MLLKAHTGVHCRWMRLAGRPGFKGHTKVLAGAAPAGGPGTSRGTMIQLLASPSWTRLFPPFAALWC